MKKIIVIFILVLLFGFLFPNKVFAEKYVDLGEYVSPSIGSTDVKSLDSFSPFQLELPENTQIKFTFSFSQDGKDFIEADPNKYYSQDNRSYSLGEAKNSLGLSGAQYLKIKAQLFTSNDFKTPSFKGFAIKYADLDFSQVKTLVATGTSWRFIILIALIVMAIIIIGYLLIKNKKQSIEQNSRLFPKKKLLIIITSCLVLAIAGFLIWLNQSDKIVILGDTVEKELVKNDFLFLSQGQYDNNKIAVEDQNGSALIRLQNKKPVENPQKYTWRWNDDFDNKTERWDEANWTFAESESEFSKNNISFAGGQLKLALTQKDENQGNYPAKPYWGGEYYSTNEYSYGKYVVKMKPNSPSGVVSSFFLIHNDDNDWREIDIEFPGKTNQVQYNVRWMEEGKTGVQDDEHLVDLGFNASEDFHEYTIEWTPEFIVFLVDGKLSYQYTDSKILKEIAEPMSVRMNYWISNSPEWAGPFDKSVLPLETYYDWVAYYELNR